MIIFKAKVVERVKVTFLLDVNQHFVFVFQNFIRIHPGS